METRLPIAPSLTPAAQYVRMSDETQQLSIANQKAAIEEYAKKHNFVVIRSYEDSGKSGLALKHRTGLCELIQDVVSGHPNYKAILVYDVSRWGRFQNSDEAAHYEFMCTSAGIPLHYCAEQFTNDSTPSNALLKALKRSMAAEFSRELGEKVFRGKTRLAQLGFWVGGMAGYGHCRLMISVDGRPKQRMKHGERKSLTTDRVILVPGPRWEVECLRKMFRMVLEGNGCTAVARELNRQGITCYGKPWSHRQVHLLLTSPKYTGCNVWNRTSEKLGGKRHRNPQTQWIMKAGAFAPIVDQGTFDRVQFILKRKATEERWSDEEIIRFLKKLLFKKGRLSENIIVNARGAPSTDTIRSHFGPSYAEIYRRVGFDYDPLHALTGEQAARSNSLRRAIMKQLVELFPGNLAVTRLQQYGRSILRVDDRFYVSLILARRKQRNRQGFHFVVEPNPAERDFITLLCLMNPDHSAALHSYLFPRMNFKSHRSYDNDPWLLNGTHLKALNQFYDAAQYLFRTRKLYAIAS